MHPPTNCKDLDSPDSYTMGGSRESEYLTAPATEDATTSSSHSSSYFSARNDSMRESKESGGCSGNIINEQIEQSKSHWSETVSLDCWNEDEVVDNVEVFEELQRHPTRGSFFKTFGEGADGYDELVIGEKFAEGGQAELYHAQIKWNDPKDNEHDLEHELEWVVKVFKKGTFLRHLQSQWPKGMFQYHAERRERNKLKQPHGIRYFCDVYCGTLLEDGRFAFLLRKEHEDLRSLIDRGMLKSGCRYGPFPKEIAEGFMYRIAVGMDWLHRRNIVHRDLKASNVLVYKHANGDYKCYVADFECSIGIVGTGFFRAPEVLQACKDGNVSEKDDLFTKEVDVYSYGMTCYEILTGKLPFKGHPWRDYDLVLNGHRPEVPKFVDKWAHELLNRCWQSNPALRPSFEEIQSILVAHSKSATIRRIAESIKADKEHIPATVVRSLCSSGSS